MPEPNATLNGGNAQIKRAGQEATRAMTSEANPEYSFIGNANLMHTPAYFVRIFNVSEVEVKIERPWVNFNPTQRGKMIVIPARKEGERVSKPFLIADIVQVPIRNDSNKTYQSIGQRGEFLAQDALNPEDMTGSWKTVRTLSSGSPINEGTNLYHQGLFWTRNETPTDEEVDAAISRLEANYNRLIDEAKILWATGEQGRLQIGNTHRRAAQYFGMEFEWNVLYKSLQECPGCGSKISKAAVVCPKCPAVFNWEKALGLGLRTVDQAVAAGIMEPQAESMAPKRARRKTA